MPVGTPKYITAQQVVEKTTSSTLADLDLAEVEKLILRSEDRIDAYFGNRPHHEDDEDEHRVFPRHVVDEDDDGVVAVPHQVETACLYTVEYLHIQGLPKTASEMQSPLASESMNAKGYAFTRGKAADARKHADAALIPTEAKMLLDQLKDKAYALQA